LLHRNVINGGAILRVFRGVGTFNEETFWAALIPIGDAESAGPQFDSRAPWISIACTNVLVFAALYRLRDQQEQNPTRKVSEAEMIRPTACFARLMMLLRNRGRSPEDAEDLIQEALLRLQEYCKTQEVRDEESFLKRTVINLSIDQHRRTVRHPFSEETVEELDQRLSIWDARPAPDEILASQQRLEDIGRILDSAGSRTREIYFAHRAGYSYQEISAALGISHSTIEKAIARAVVALMDMKDPP
jgi:RNA polymerase sigma factor (sigma-70 family)